MSDENEQRFVTLVDDVLLWSALQRLQSKPINLVMLALGVGMTIALEKPEWARQALDEISSDERIVASAQRLVAARMYVEASEAAPAKRGRRA